jgi:hypothetical protein
MAAEQPQPSDAPFFSATPVSGEAPLTVKFCASAGIGIDFGDGTSGGMGPAQTGDCSKPAAVYATHVYEKPGTYKLGGFPCPGVNAAQCGAVADQARTLTVTVTSK